MSLDIQKFTTPDVISIPFGMRLKSAREARGLESKDVAAQLRLSEKIISMIEKENYPSDLPVTFIRGYIRAYARLMEISEAEITKALEPIKPPTTFEVEEHELIEPQPVTSGNYFMQFFTYLILLTIVSLVGVWWYTQSSPDNHSAMTSEISITQNQNTTNVSSNESAVPFSNGEVKAGEIGGSLSKGILTDANKMSSRSLSEANESNLQSSNGRVVIETIAGHYSIQIGIYFILFLLIGFAMLWWQAHASKNPKIFITILLGFSIISLVGLWWYYYSPLVSPVSTKQIKGNNQIITPEYIAPITIPKTESEPPIDGTKIPETQTEALPAIPTKMMDSNQPTNESPSVNMNAEPAKTESTPSSSGQYTPVPSTKKHSKHKKKTHPLASAEKTPLITAQAENEFADLDKDDNY